MLTARPERAQRGARLPDDARARAGRAADRRALVDAAANGSNPGQAIFDALADWRHLGQQRPPGRPGRDAARLLRARLRRMAGLAGVRAGVPRHPHSRTGRFFDIFIRFDTSVATAAADDVGRSCSPVASAPACPLRAPRRDPARHRRSCSPACRSSRPRPQPAPAPDRRRPRPRLPRRRDHRHRARPAFARNRNNRFTVQRPSFSGTARRTTDPAPLPAPRRHRRPHRRRSPAATAPPAATRTPSPRPRSAPATTSSPSTSTRAAPTPSCAPSSTGRPTSSPSASASSWTPVAPPTPPSPTRRHRRPRQPGHPPHPPRRRRHRAQPITLTHDGTGTLASATTTTNGEAFVTYSAPATRRSSSSPPPSPTAA